MFNTFFFLIFIKTENSPGPSDFAKMSLDKLLLAEQGVRGNPIVINQSQTQVKFDTPTIRSPSMSFPTSPVSAQAPSMSFAAPSINAQVPSMSYAAPSMNAQAPSMSYAAPSMSSIIPSMSFAAPSINTQAPSMSFAAPSMNAFASSMEIRASPPAPIVTMNLTPPKIQIGTQ